MTQGQKDRLAWLKHCLQDGDAGRLWSLPQLYQMDEEREHLQALADAEELSGDGPIPEQEDEQC